MKFRTCHRLAFSIGVMLLMPTAFHVRATPSTADPFAFFQPAVTLTTDDRDRLDHGQPVAHVMPGKELEVGVWAAVPVNIEGDRLVAWMRRIEELKKSKYVLAIGRFSDPPRLDDLAGLSLDDEDVSAIANCHAGACGLKLSATEIAALQQAAGQPGGVQLRFRQIVLDRVETYLAGGRIGPYADSADQVWPGEEFDTLLDHSLFLTMHDRSFADSLRGAPATLASHDESFLYWSKESLGGKSTISVTDVHIARGDDTSSLPDVVVAGKQIFATHYVNASLGLTALVRGGPGHPNYLVYVNRSEVDVLHGAFAGIVRWVLQRRLRAEAGTVLEGLRHRVESGEPPPAGPAATP